MNPFSLITGFANNLIERLFPNKDEQQKAKLVLAEMDFKKFEAQIAVMVAEAKSNDKWTSRARPSFLYVIYTMILAAIPMGIVYAVSPETAENVATGMKEWLGAIPDYLWGVFGVGYTGYVAGRSFDKSKILNGKNN